MYMPVSAYVFLLQIGSEVEFSVGTRVIVGSRFCGTVRFAGLTNFAPGKWYGVELDKPMGRNNGSVNGKCYFTCKENHGIFAPPSKLKPFRINPRISRMHSEKGVSDLNINIKTIQRRNSAASEKSGGQLSSNATSQNATSGNVTVYVPSVEDYGIIRYVGPVTFARGLWFGIEFNSPKGNNDGEVMGNRYFECKEDHGLLLKPNMVRQVAKPSFPETIP